MATLPPKQLASGVANKKSLTLELFAAGVNSSGDQGQVERAMQYQPCDVAMMLGWVHEQGKKAPHLAFRQQIIDEQRRRNCRTVIADSNLFLYSDTGNPHYYLRYSFDGVFPDTGEYCDSGSDREKWSRIQMDHGIQVRPWRESGKHVLICLQREGGWSMQGRSILDWTLETITELRKHTNRPLRIRVHPGDRKSRNYLDVLKKQQCFGDLEFSSPEQDLREDLRDCWAAVNHNSSPVVAAAILGIPIFVTDPIRSQARDVANTSLGDIENPLTPDRETWLQRLAQFHWSHEDLRSGQCWSHMRKWVKI